MPRSSTTSFRRVWILGLLFVCLSVRADEGLRGRAAPEIGAAGWINGPRASVSSLRGKAVLLTYWASWCSRSRKAMDLQRELWKEDRGAPLRIVALTEEEADPVSRFVEVAELPFLVGWGTSSREAFGAHEIPTAFVIGPDGKVLWSGDPLDAACAEWTRRAVEEARR